ncbi:hypothetical protein SSTG_02969 [Streptomyces sp. e14]|nr:hypothetical protein SSTG_02969 [Streptomyces sp. e14]
MVRGTQAAGRGSARGRGEAAAGAAYRTPVTCGDVARRQADARFGADAASLRCGVPRGRVGRAEWEGAGDGFRRTRS